MAVVLSFKSGAEDEPPPLNVIREEELVMGVETNLIGWAINPKQPALAGLPPGTAHTLFAPL